MNESLGFQTGVRGTSVFLSRYYYSRSGHILYRTYFIQTEHILDRKKSADSFALLTDFMIKFILSVLASPVYHVLCRLSAAYAGVCNMRNRKNEGSYILYIPKTLIRQQLYFP